MTFWSRAARVFRNVSPLPCPSAPAGALNATTLCKLERLDRPQYRRPPDAAQTERKPFALSLILMPAPLANASASPGGPPPGVFTVIKRFLRPGRSTSACKAEDFTAPPHDRRPPYATILADGTIKGPAASTRRTPGSALHRRGRAAPPSSIGNAQPAHVPAG